MLLRFGEQQAVSGGPETDGAVAMVGQVGRSAADGGADGGSDYGAGVRTMDEKQYVTMNKRGKVVSKKMHAHGKKAFSYIKAWHVAGTKARQVLGVNGLIAIGGKKLESKRSMPRPMEAREAPEKRRRRTGGAWTPERRHM